MEKALEKLDIFGVFLTENKLHLKCITCAGYYDNKLFTTKKSRTETVAHVMTHIGERDTTISSIMRSFFSVFFFMNIPYHISGDSRCPIFHIPALL